MKSILQFLIIVLLIPGTAFAQSARTKSSQAGKKAVVKTKTLSANKPSCCSKVPSRFSAASKPSKAKAPRS